MDEQVIVIKRKNYKKLVGIIDKECCQFKDGDIFYSNG